MNILNNKPLHIGGPCSVKSREQILRIAKGVKAAGGHAIRTQLWKPRTRPDSFQGVGEKGIAWVKEVKEETGLPVCMEMVDPSQVGLVEDIADILWVGSRNMQNYELLKKIAEDSQQRPVILKRGLIANLKELLGAAEYIGKDRVIICERGIRTGADAMRFTLDLNTALAIKHDHHLPIIVDPSHSPGRRDMVPYLACAAMAAGVDGLVIETHYNPEEELVDKDQTITLETYAQIVATINDIYKLTQKLSGKHMNQITKIRQTIDELDKEILYLLNKRAVTVNDMRKAKRDAAVQVLDSKREEKIYHRLHSLNQGSLPNKNVDNLYQSLLTEMKDCMYQPAIYYIGPWGTFSHAAADMVNQGIPKIPCKNFKEAIQKASEEPESYCLLPVKNSIIGDITETTSLLKELNYKRVEEIAVPISMNLATKKSSNEIKTIYSKQQALDQCSNYLQTQYPTAKIVASPSTTSNIETLKEGEAVICSPKACELFELNVIDKNIQNEKDNNTTFYLIQIT